MNMWTVTALVVAILAAISCCEANEQNIGHLSFAEKAQDLETLRHLNKRSTKDEDEIDEDGTNLLKFRILQNIVCNL